MSLTERETATKDQYNLTAEKWLEKSGGRNRPSYWEGELKSLKSCLKEGDTVLELGCGPATDAKFLRDLNLKTVSVDYSRTMLKIAKEINPDSTLSEMDIYKLGFADNSFNGFCAIATLLHLEHPQKALKEIARVTKDKGVGFISVKEGGKETLMDKSGYYFNYFSDDEFSGLLTNSGFEILDKVTDKTGTPRHNWLTYLVKVHKW